jgi:hypothetical protein
MSERRELRTWQEIANYLGLSVRAVQNYEKTAGLPVHRLTGQTRGHVWAYTDELDAWKSRVFTGRGGTALVATLPGNRGDNESSAPASLAPFPFSNHWGFGSLLCGLYALLWAEAVILEVAYRFDLFGRRALLVAVLVFCWVAVTFLSGLAADWRRTASGEPGGLFLCVTIVYGSAALLQLALWWVLPKGPITEQTGRQPWSAQAAYLKNVVLYFLPLATIYILLPFHFVLAVQREVAAQRHGPVLALLTGERKAAAPESVYLRAGWLAVALFVVALLAVVMTQDLFDHLKPNPYKTFFMYLALGRTLLVFGVALLCLLWYSRVLNKIKEECLRQEAIKSGVGR